MSAIKNHLSFFMNARMQEVFAFEKAAWDQSQRLHEFLTMGGADRMRQFHFALIDFTESCRRLHDLGRMPATLKRLEAISFNVSDLIIGGDDQRSKLAQLESALKIKTPEHDSYQRSVSIFRVWTRRCEFYAGRIVKKTR